MARILVTFYNCIKDPANPDAMPVFYETFVNGLDRAGNEVAVISHDLFGVDFGEIDENTRQEIVEFAPDVCFVFNNSFYDLSKVVDCPIIIYEVDSVRYFSNKNSIKENADRYLFFIFQKDSANVLINEYGIKERQIFYVPFFTEIYSDDSVIQTSNISFIGSLFMGNHIDAIHTFIENSPTSDERKMMKACLDELRRNPQITYEELLCKCNVTSGLVAKCVGLDMNHILTVLSGERRLKLLSAVVDLGLDLYGTKTWGNIYYFNTDLNLAFNDKNVYSIKHNQDIYNSSKIGISVSYYQATNGFPWRVMDIMASNACLVTDRHSDFSRLFGNIPLPIYETELEAYEVCKRLLEDESRRRDIVLQCQEVVNSKFRFKHILPQLEEYSGVIMHVQHDSTR